MPIYDIDYKDGNNQDLKIPGAKEKKGKWSCTSAFKTFPAASPYLMDNDTDSGHFDFLSDLRKKNYREIVRLLSKNIRYRMASSKIYNNAGTISRNGAAALLIKELEKLILLGAKKYTLGGWRFVKNWEDDYTDAFCRHLLEFETGNFLSDMEIPHDIHCLWNACALLELSKNEKS